MMSSFTEEEVCLLVQALDAYYDLERGRWARSQDEESKAAALRSTELREKIRRATARAESFHEVKSERWLQEQIELTWGEHGAHAEVFRDILSNTEEA